MPSSRLATPRSIPLARKPAQRVPRIVFSGRKFAVAAGQEARARDALQAAFQDDDVQACLDKLKAADWQQQALAALKPFRAGIQKGGARGRAPAPGSSARPSRGGWRPRTPSPRLPPPDSSASTSAAALQSASSPLVAFLLSPIKELHDLSPQAATRRLAQLMIAAELLQAASDLHPNSRPLDRQLDA